jgi:hypothetical protein
VDIPSRLTIELDNADVEDCKTTSAKRKVVACTQKVQQRAHLPGHPFSNLIHLEMKFLVQAIGLKKENLSTLITRGGKVDCPLQLVARPHRRASQRMKLTP